MPPRPFVNDALWRCLCPRFSQLPASLSCATAGKKAFSSNRVPACAAAESVRKRQLRTYNTSTLSTRDPFPASDGGIRSALAPKPNLRPGNPRRGQQKTAPLVHQTVPELYERLRIDGAKGRHVEVMSIIKILIKDRRERPNAHMYTALLHSYANCEEGTAGKVRKILEEMESAGIELDGRGAECVLEALAVHPDYLLRNDILEYMKERWFNLSERGHNFVAAGLLRDRCFEQALAKLEEMIKHGVKVHGWLWDQTIWILLEFGEVEEALYVLNLRHNVVESGAKLSNALWLELLDAAGKRHLVAATKLIWNTQVLPGYLKPPTGTCLNVLSIAARKGEVGLATDVFRVLAERETILTAHHYEALVECYLNANDLPAALSVILIMQESGLKFSTGTLHPLHAYLSKEPSRPQEAFTQLQDLQSTEKRIPVAAVNACIQASITLQDLGEAINFYKSLHTVCAPAGPNVDTFNILFQGCHRNGRKELAMYLATEMIQLGVRPTRITYDRLILTCLNAKDLDDAMLYYEEMVAEGYVPRRGTFENLIRAALDKGDPRCVALVKEYRKKDVGPEARAAMFETMVMGKFDTGGSVGRGLENGGEDARSETAGLVRRV